MSSSIAFVEDFVALITKYESTIACNNRSVNSIIAKMMNNAYKATMEYMVTCEILKLENASLSSDGKTVTVTSIHSALQMDMTNLSVHITVLSGAEVNVRKVNNELAAAEVIQKAVTVLNAVHNSSELADLLDITNARIAYFLAIATAASPIMDELNKSITTALEDAND